MTWEIALAIARFFLAVVGIITTVAIAGSYYHNADQREKKRTETCTLNKEYIIVVPELPNKNDLVNSPTLRAHIANGCIFVMEHEYMTFLKYFDVSPDRIRDATTLTLHGYIAYSSGNYTSVDINYNDGVGVLTIWNQDVMLYYSTSPSHITSLTHQLISRDINKKDSIYPLIQHGHDIACRMGTDAMIYFNNMTCGKIVEVERREDDE